MIKALTYGLGTQLKLDLRRRDVLIMYYLMPIAFFLFMGGIFTSIDPNMENTLISAMTIFAVCVGGYMGAPLSVGAFYHSEVKKAYKVGHIPLWTPMFNSFLTALFNLSVVSLLIALVSPAVFGAAALDNVGRHIVVAAVLLLANIAAGLMLGMLVKSQSKLSMVSIVVFMPSILLSGIMLPPGILPDVFDKIGSVLPSRWAYEAMQGIDVTKNVLLLLVVFIVAMLVALVRLKRISKE